MSAPTVAKVVRHTLTGSVWKPGDLVAGFRRLPFRKAPEYSVLLCVKAREVGPRGVVRAPAESVSITAPSWAACKRAIVAEGFVAPRLTATQVREGKA